MFKTLFSKLYFVMTVPVVGLLIVAFSYTSSLYENYETYNRNLDHVPLIVSSYELLSELQKERGMSAAFLSGADNFSSLKSQRVNSSKAVESFLPLIRENEYLKEDELIEKLEGISKVRGRIESKSLSKKETLSIYTKVIVKLMNLKLALKSDSTSERVQDYMNDLLIIEDAKESGGKLRANLSSFLARNTPVSSSELLLVISLRSELFVNLKSKAISWNDSSKAIIDKFYSSKDTKFVNDTFELFLRKDKEGDFGVDPVIFFSSISRSLGIIDELVKLKQSELKKFNYSKKTVNWEKFLTTLIVITIFLVGILFFAKYFIQKIIVLFRQGLHNLNNKVFAIRLIFNKIDSSAQKISKRSIEQTGSIQSVSKIIHEVEDIIKKSDLDTKGASDSSKRSLLIVQEGKVIVEEVHGSIQALDRSNKELELMIEKFSLNFKKILEIISEISTRTSVINDIVFQTKLLSFNASVESARAGEHGKGFAVVAEEIGSLASMSGTASDEITTLINSSNEMVKSIIDEMNESTSSFISENKNKLAESLDNSGKCSDIFEKIKNNFEDISNKIDSLYSSSKKQTMGIQSISSSISQIDIAVDEVEKTSSSNVQVTERASVNVDNLVSTINELCMLVRGDVIVLDEKDIDKVS